MGNEPIVKIVLGELTLTEHAVVQPHSLCSFSRRPSQPLGIIDSYSAEGASEYLGDPLGELSLQLAQPFVFVAIRVNEEEHMPQIFLPGHHRIALMVRFEYVNLPARCVQGNPSPPIAIFESDNELFLPLAGFA